MVDFVAREKKVFLISLCRIDLLELASQIFMSPIISRPEISWGIIGLLEPKPRNI